MTAIVAKRREAGPTVAGSLPLRPRPVTAWSAHTDADRADYMQLVFANFYFVPAAAVVGGLCLLSRSSRPFGQALLYSTAFSALAFTMVC